MGKFCDISTELWPFIDVRNSFTLSIFGIFYRFFFELCMSVDIGTEFLWIADSFRQIITELCPLIDVQNCVLLYIF